MVFLSIQLEAVDGLIVLFGDSSSRFALERVSFSTKPAPEVRVRDESTQYSLLNND
jgi:hypothetical protein